MKLRILLVFLITIFSVNLSYAIAATSERFAQADQLIKEHSYVDGKRQHATTEVSFKELPSYEELKKLVLQELKGELKYSASSIYSK